MKALPPRRAAIKIGLVVDAQVRRLLSRAEMKNQVRRVLTRPGRS
jgi:hypothetical protein